MDIQEIKERIKNGQPVTAEEESAYMEALVAELQQLKKTNPETYLQLLNNVASKLEEVNGDFDAILEHLKK